MSLTEGQVEKIAHLSRLGLTGAEPAEFQVELDTIVDFVDKLEPYDSSSVPPSNQVTGRTNVFRPDQTEPCPDAADLIKQSPHRDRYSVPSVRTLWKTA